MKKRILAVSGLLALMFCLLSACKGKSGQQEEMLLLPVSEEVETKSAEPEQEEEEKENASCVVHVCGAVENPGVYILEEGSRVYQAIEKAGGFRSDADADYLNQADLLTDGAKLYVPSMEETEEIPWNPTGSGQQEENGLVNINTADEAVLCTLPGVGSSKAKSIIAYREKNGAFQATEDIMNVDGIKDGLYQKIKDSITV